MAVGADVTDQAQMSEVVGQAADRFGTLDVLVNNAAIYYDLDLTNQSLDYGRKVLDVNLFGIIIAARAVFPWMKRQRSGAIINIATVGAFPPGGLGGANRFAAPELETVPVFYYGLAKSGVVWLTKTMAIDLGRYNIRVNAIAPGVVLSEATKRGHYTSGDRASEELHGVRPQSRSPGTSRVRRGVPGLGGRGAHHRTG